MIDRFRSPLKAGETLYACWCGMSDPFLIGAIARQKFDVVVLDAQHGFHEETSIRHCIPHVVNAGKSPLVRIPVDRWDLVQRALDFGALGVIAPMVNNRKDAEAFASSAKFPQSGVRSYGPRHAATLYGLEVGDYVEAANHSTLALAQIETREAYENLDEILGVEGIDGILMGPSDFSIFMTGKQTPDAYGEATLKAIKDIADRTNTAGKVAAAFTLTAEHAELVKEFGYQLISVALDSSVIAKGTEAVFASIEA